MATNVEVTCDRCGDPITSARTSLEFVLGGGDQWATSPFSGRPAIDLCCSCYSELTAWIKEDRGTTPQLAEETKHVHDRDVA